MLLLLSMGKTHSAQNNAVTTIQNCAEEPIHIPGSIQPHGFVLVIDAQEAIALCSQNAELFLNTSNTDLLAKHYSTLPQSLATAISNYITGGKKSSMVPQPVELNGLHD